MEDDVTKTWNIYLSGEIHSDWREQIQSMTAQAGLPVAYSSPVTNHEASDDCGAKILGGETDPVWHDRKGAQINAIRTRTLIQDADVVVVRFGEKYRQWNAAFDAGFAAALGKPLIILHPEEHRHALKEVDAAALAVAQTPEQVSQVLAYVITGQPR
ncbi:MAG: YtoQ family protein [Acidimicrobiia bacterium]|nr:YtoQ family protein [Acidimicrobiia bacterium]